MTKNKDYIFIAAALVAIWVAVICVALYSVSANSGIVQIQKKETVAQVQVPIVSISCIHIGGTIKDEKERALLEIDPHLSSVYSAVENASSEVVATLNPDHEVTSKAQRYSKKNHLDVGFSDDHSALEWIAIKSSIG